MTLRQLPFGLGAIPSPPDDRDYPIALDEAAPLPSRFVSPLMPPPGNQGNTGRVETEAVPAHGFPQSLSLVLPPLAALFLKPEPLTLS